MCALDDSREVELLIVTCSDFEVREHLFDVLLGEVDMSSGLGLVLVLGLVLAAVLGVSIGISFAGAGTSEEQALEELVIGFCARHHGSNFS